MTNSKELLNDLISRVTLNEEKAEIQSIIYLLLENKFGLTKTDVLSGKLIHTVNQPELNLCIERINNQEPIQYILKEAFFFGRFFKVNPAVLIPRPETELLIHEIIQSRIGNTNPIRILDIGTGSGCIAISLALEIKNATVTASDISPTALDCATENAMLHKAPIHFIEHDILNAELTEAFDLIISNPPYIAIEEKSTMKPNVLEFEPHLALFAPENDPLIFYRKIIEKSKNALLANGSLWFEINENYSINVCEILKARGFENVNVIQDMSGKERVVWGSHQPKLASLKI